MKDTDLLREWVDSTIEKYYKQIGVDKLPRAIYSLNEAPKEVQCHHLAQKHKQFAAVFFMSKGKKPHYILFNIPYHKSYRELENTIAHEMIHLRFPHLEHDEEYKPSEDFFTKLGMILMGKHYGRSRKKVHKHKHV